MSNRIGRTQVGGYEWNLDNRGRYAIYRAVGISGVIVGWAVTREGESVIDRGDRPKTLVEAMNAAYAHAKTIAAKNQLPDSLKPCACSYEDVTGATDAVMRHERIPEPTCPQHHDENPMEPPC